MTSTKKQCQASKDVSNEPLPETNPASQPVRPVIRYVTIEEAMKAYENTLPRHEEAYRALAKL